MATATVVNIATPTITPSGSISICLGSSTLLSAPTGFLNYVWSNGANTQQISVSNAGNYSVQAGDGSYLSASSVPVTVSVSAPIAKPTITAIGNTTLCGSSTVQLSVPTGFSSYAWSNGAATSSITVSTAGNYVVSVSDGPCTSPSADPVAVTSVVVPLKPTISINGSASLCNGANVGLEAPTGFQFYVWSNGETSRQIVVNTAGNFSVQTGNAARCLSVASDAVVVTLSGQTCGGNIPPPPGVTSASRCGVGTVSLSTSGATGGQVYYWYDLASGGTLLFTGTTFDTPSISSTTTYYASIYDPAFATESNRVLATATVVNIPTPTITGPHHHSCGQ